MHIVEVRVADGDFAGRMSGMRVWLDSRHCEPAAFRYTHADDAVAIVVEFTIESEAEAFAAEFGGLVKSP